MLILLLFIKHPAIVVHHANGAKSFSKSIVKVNLNLLFIIHIKIVISNNVKNADLIGLHLSIFIIPLTVFTRKLTGGVKPPPVSQGAILLMISLFWLMPEQELLR